MTFSVTVNWRTSFEVAMAASGTASSLLSMIDQEARKRIEALEAQGVQRDCEIAVLSGRLSRLAAMLEAIRMEAPGARVPAAGPPPPKSAVSSAAASRSPASTSTSPPAVMLPPAPAGFASLIIADFPALFAEFRGKGFTLLWRGSRDGFRAGDFHDRCDGHANTLTFIEDTERNIFGGFTPVKWETPSSWKAVFGDDGNRADWSLKSFLFTLKNPHKFPARKFALKAEQKAQKKSMLIGCNSTWGPHFCDICVYDNCNANSTSWTELGRCYANDTGLKRETFFTGSLRFRVKEIEVFEITD
jgi:hypothetical protein